MSIRDHRGESVAGYANYQFYAERDYWERRYLADAPYEWWCGAAELLPLLDLLLPGQSLDDASAREIFPAIADLGVIRKLRVIDLKSNQLSDGAVKVCWSVFNPPNPNPNSNLGLRKETLYTT